MTHNPNDAKTNRGMLPTQTQRVHTNKVYTNTTKTCTQTRQSSAIVRKIYKNKVGDERTRQEIGDAPTHPPVNAGGMKLKSYKPKC